MAWFHDSEGRPATWRTGRFDPEHLYPLLVIVAAVVLMWLTGGK